MDYSPIGNSQNGQQWISENIVVLEFIAVLVMDDAPSSLTAAPTERASQGLHPQPADLASRTRRLWQRLLGRCTIGGHLLLVRGVKRRSWPVRAPAAATTTERASPSSSYHRSVPCPSSYASPSWVMALLTPGSSPRDLIRRAGPEAQPRGGWGNWLGHEDPLASPSGKVLATTSRPSSPISTSRWRPAKMYLFSLFCRCAVHRLILAPCSVPRLTLTPLLCYSYTIQTLWLDYQMLHILDLCRNTLLTGCGVCGFFVIRGTPILQQWII
jgi:hypothetical protein